MQNQSSYDKVNSSMIAPLNLFFRTRLDDAVVEAMVEDLDCFTREVLKDAFKEIRRNCKKMPSLAEVLGFCRESKKRLPTTEKATANNNDKPAVYGCAKAEDVHPETVREILSTPAGQLALELGVGFSLMVEYERSGKKEFDTAWVRNQCKCFKEGIEQLEKNRANFAYSTLAGLLNTMSNREKSLYRKFYQKQVFGIAV